MSEYNDLAVQLAELWQRVERQEQRIAALEARLDPKTREQATADALDDPLDELSGKDPLDGLFDDLPKEIADLNF